MKRTIAHLLLILVCFALGCLFAGCSAKRHVLYRHYLMDKQTPRIERVGQ